MKKLLLIFIVFVTSLSYCQTAEDYFKRGMSKDSLKDRRGAIEDYTKSIELNPNFSEAYFNRGLSKASLANRIKFTTNDNGTYYDIALEKTNLEDRRGAIDDYTKAIELNPNYSEAYFNRGLSKASLAKRKRLNSNGTEDTSYDSALEKTNLEDRRGAIDDYTKAIELNPNYSEAYYNRGFSKNELKDKKGARLDWAKAKELKK